MICEATTDGKRIYSKHPYADGEGPRLAKKIAGASWRKLHKDWSYPLTIDTCYALRNVFGDGLKVSKVLAEWARKEIGHRSTLDSIRTGMGDIELARLTSEAPALARAIATRTYQVQGAAFLVKGQHVLLGDQPGLGKTLQTLSALIESGSHKILVACPRTATRTVWERETARWAPAITTYVAQGARADRQKVMDRFLAESARNTNPRMLIINIEMMRAKRVDVNEEARKENPNILPLYLPVHEWPELSQNIEWDAIVVDEAHNALASTSGITSKNITQVRYGAMQVRHALAPEGLAIALSGTPFRSKLKKAWGTLNWLRPDVFTSFWRWADVEKGGHFRVSDNGYGSELSAEPVDLERFQLEMRPYYLARTKKEAAPDLPPIAYAGTEKDGFTGVWLDMEGKQAKAYKEMRDMARVRLETEELTAVGILAELTRLRQFACSYADYDGENVYPALPSNKIDWILEFLSEREGNDGKTVLTSSFSKLVYLLYDALEKEGHTSLTLTGATSDRDRLRLVERFADPRDKARVAILNTHAGGEAITLDAADDMIFLDLPWTSDQADQVESRIHRVSRIHNVTVYRLLSVDTIDTRMALINDDQRKILASARPEARDLALELLG